MEKLLRAHGMRPTPENVAVLTAILKVIPTPPRVASERIEILADQLVKAAKREGFPWAGVQHLYEEVRDSRVCAELERRDYVNGRFVAKKKLPPTIRVDALRELHRFYCHQRKLAGAPMTRNSGKRNAAGKRSHAPALRFVTEAMQLCDPRITIGRVALAAKSLGH